VRGATQEFCEYRNFHSPRVYGDQFARFNSGGPLSAIELALVEEGWVERNEALVEMGLQFVGGANFRIPFDRRRRIMWVVVNSLGGDEWRLTVKCYRQARAGGTGEKIPIRGHRADGTPQADELAPELSYEVAMVVHSALADVASDIRWSVHHDPTCGRYSTEPASPNGSGTT